MLLLLQLSVLLWDTAYPQKTSTATLTLSISRNENPPKWSKPDYKVKVNDRYKLGDEIVTVKATDEDKVTRAKFRIVYVCRYVKIFSESVCLLGTIFTKDSPAAIHWRKIDAFKCFM